MEDLLKNMNGSPKDEREIPGLVSRRKDGTIVVGPHRDLIPT